MYTERHFFFHLVRLVSGNQEPFNVRYSVEMATFHLKWMSKAKLSYV